MTILDTDTHILTPTTASAMTFYGKMLTFSRLQINTDDLAAIDAQLAGMLSNKTSNIPVIIDSDIMQDLSALVDLLWSWGLQPIGVLKGELEEQARAQRLAIFPADGKRIERILPSKKPATQITQTEVSAAPEVPLDDTVEPLNANDSIDATALPAETLISAEHITSMIYDQMLRSGQSINHVGGDLILTNSVNSGAEAITDNNLHVYGRAQGRLVAGATGDKDARIFCQIFNPSLVSVAGTYCLRDNLPKEVIDKPVQVTYVEGQGLVFRVIDQA
ncbi:septum site-determining protein MinC [Psychrobacter frigidicola]|uniref:Probable septum site-determining protein MinC n=1 Tax=Psychrobacter frigidicola TaxID=45611 RepID=A0A5C6ZZW8_9GAMM|nr:septum site-determining protein MinC [Psychrobacter frigidicola]TXD96406.1 septum site-determining protein MinC [Psychrobacter frigidicola]